MNSNPIDSNSNIDNTAGTEQQQEYVFTPTRFNLRGWTVVTGRSGGRAEFNGRLKCEQGVCMNLNEFIRTSVYTNRDAGDIVLDLNDLRDIGGQCHFELLRLTDRDLSDYEVKRILKRQNSLLVVKMGTVFYLCINNTHVYITNMFNPDIDRAEIKWNVVDEPLRFTREMNEVWETSDQFRREFQAQFRAATFKEEYEPENSPFAKAMKVAKPIKAADSPQEWTTDGKTTPLHALPTPVEEMTLDDIEVAKRRKLPTAAPRIKKTAEG